MKKILFIVAVTLTATLANASIFNWALSAEDGVKFYTYNSATGGNSDSLFSGTLNLYLYAVNGGSADSAQRITTATISDGIITAKTFRSYSSDDEEAVGMPANRITDAGLYNFFFTYEDTVSGETFTSATITNLATSELPVGTAVQFASNSGSWSGEAVPEPTSGLLLLCGLAGLALRRKKV